MSTEQEQPGQAPEQAQQLTAEESAALLQDGFDGKATPTEQAGEQTREEPKQQEEQPKPAEPEYVRMTKAELDSLNARVAKVDELQAAIERLNGTAFGKIGGLERSINELRAQSTIPQIDLTDETVKEVAADFPSLGKFAEVLRKAKPVDQEALIALATEKIKPILDQYTAQAESAAEQKAWRRTSAELLYERHADWQDVGQSQEFWDHVKSRGQEYADRLEKASQSWDWRQISEAMTSFKTSKAEAAAEDEARRQRLAANVTPRGSATPAQPGMSESDLLNEGFRNPFGGRR